MNRSEDSVTPYEPAPDTKAAKGFAALSFGRRTRAELSLAMGTEPGSVDKFLAPAIAAGRIVVARFDGLTHFELVDPANAIPLSRPERRRGRKRGAQMTESTDDQPRSKPTGTFPEVPKKNRAGDQLAAMAQSPTVTVGEVDVVRLPCGDVLVVVGDHCTRLARPVAHEIARMVTA